MSDGVEPLKYIYGEKKQLVVESIRESSHREPTEYDQYNRPINWVKLTSYSIRFKNGGWFEGQVQNQNINIHRGDVFEAFVFDNHYTYLKNVKTDRVILDKPLINPEWQTYMNEIYEAEKMVWNQKSTWQRISQKKVYLLMVLVLLGIACILSGSYYVMILLPIIYFLMLKDR